MHQNSPAPAAIDVRDLSFYYLTPEKRRWFTWLPLKRVYFRKMMALEKVSLSIRPGRITALMGKNGSGKTTLIKIITGARFPHGGKVTVLGTTPTAARSKVGLCLGGTLVYHRLTARENLEYFGKLYGVKDVNGRIDELCTLLDLNAHLDQMVETFSFGMKAKLAIARAMIHSPELLILDEPTLGIDFQIAEQIRHFIRNLKCTVLLTTHYMEEAEMLADDLCIIDHGRILSGGDKPDVLAALNASSVSQAFVNALTLAHRGLEGVSR